VSTIVTLHAHPDDETLLTGGWLAQRSAAGDRVVLVVATDGEGGLASPAYRTTLGARRHGELMTAATALGVARVVRLGYADSGMADAPTTGAGRFVDIPVEEAARKVAAILDEERADLLTGYDANGGYGHPDHLRCTASHARRRGWRSTVPCCGRPPSTGPGSCECSGCCGRSPGRCRDSPCPATTSSPPAAR
jgi:LmbE family N-acetylglucosaminyl deacetylase